MQRAGKTKYGKSGSKIKTHAPRSRIRRRKTWQLHLDYWSVESWTTLPRPLTATSEGVTQLGAATCPVSAPPPPSQALVP